MPTYFKYKSVCFLIILKKIHWMGLICMLYPITSNSAPPPPGNTYTSIGASGNWKTGSQWDQGSFPNHHQTNGSDVIIIDNQHKITLTDVLTVKSGTTLTITAGDTLEINGNVTFKNGSFVNVNTNGVLKINGHLTNSNNSNTITINGNLNVSGNYSGGNGSMINGTGSFDITGTVNTSGSGSVFGSTYDCSTPGTCSSTSSHPLPIVLSSFTAKKDNSIVRIKWSTQAEINNDYFSIERSKDGWNWEELERVKGAGNSNIPLEYKAVDDFPLKGSSYYRLKQTDYNGNFSYSEVKTVQFYQSGIVIYPNPVNELLTIQQLCGECWVTIYDNTGRMINNKHTSQIDTQNWSKGVYNIIIFSKNNILYSSKIIK